MYLFCEKEADIFKSPMGRGGGGGGGGGGWPGGVSNPLMCRWAGGGRGGGGVSIEAKCYLQENCDFLIFM